VTTARSAPQAVLKERERLHQAAKSTAPSDQAWGTPRPSSWPADPSLGRHTATAGDQLRFKLQMERSCSCGLITLCPRMDHQFPSAHGPCAQPASSRHPRSQRPWGHYRRDARGAGVRPIGSRGFCKQSDRAALVIAELKTELANWSPTWLMSTDQAAAACLNAKLAPVIREPEAPVTRWWADYESESQTASAGGDVSGG